jgi:hypothetical protein
MRQIRNDVWDVIRFGEEDKEPKELSLVKGGRRAYLWVGVRWKPDAGWKTIITFSGNESLRKLAEAILKEIPE